MVTAIVIGVGYDRGSGYFFNGYGQARSSPAPVTVTLYTARTQDGPVRFALGGTRLGFRSPGLGDKIEVEVIEQTVWCNEGTDFSGVGMLRVVQRDLVGRAKRLAAHFPRMGKEHFNL